MTEKHHILILAGTPEARRLASALAERFPDVRLTASFAGAVSDIPDPGIPARTGGFGGAEGLAAFIEQEHVTLVIDATHPFAEQISRNAVEAVKTKDVPLIRFERPEWKQQAGDLWESVSTLAETAERLPAEARVFLAIGRKEIAAFSHRTDLFALARMIEQPAVPLPGHWHLELGRPAQSVEVEESLLRKHRITHLVSKNSGGRQSHAKIEAARRLQVPVIMIERPEPAGAQTISDSDEVLRLVAQTVT
ncbi:cobalt-precorrin-6A reductase [uncultured Roseibium sp.]|uniref:cobalt-precorrin-6A reductase n=1 Tax=uncultured Roseibium sp. TaxID=1936171 RepID=UPI003217DBAC